MAQWSGGLGVYDLSWSTNIVRVGGADTPWYALSVQVAGPLAYVANASSGLHPFDVSNPTNLVRVGGYDTPGIAEEVRVVGTLAYVADGMDGLLVLDVSSDPANITPAGRAATGGHARDAKVAGSRIYLRRERLSNWRQRGGSGSGRRCRGAE